MQRSHPAAIWKSALEQNDDWPGKQMSGDPREDARQHRPEDPRGRDRSCSTLRSIRPDPIRDPASSWPDRESADRQAGTSGIDSAQACSARPARVRLDLARGIVPGWVRPSRRSSSASARARRAVSFVCVSIM